MKTISEKTKNNEWRKHFDMYLSKTGCGSSSTPGFSKSSNDASALSFQSSSNLLIWTEVIWRARNCSCSDGTFTSHVRKLLSSIRGIHWDVSQFISLDEGTAAQGCLHEKNWWVIFHHCKISGKKKLYNNLHNKTTTVSLLAGIKPRRNTFRQPQL